MKNSFHSLDIKRLSTYAVIAMLTFGSLMLVSFNANAQEGAHGGNPATNMTWSTTIPSGQTPNYTVSSLAFLSVSPNPIGVNQTVLVNMWLTFPSAENRYCAGYVVNITKPDGTTDQVGPMNSYVADGTAWFTYTVNQVGKWSFQFSYPGQWFPAGYYLNGEIFNSSQPGSTLYPAIYYNPAQSPVTYLTVQNDPVLSWYSPLPTDYWTRPILPNNREWSQIAGNYPYVEANIVGVTGQSSWHDNWYGPFVTAPNTPHIVWMKQGALAGIIGGEAGQSSSLASPSASGIANTPNVIFMGRGYTTVTKIMTTTISGTVKTLPVQVAECYDIQTGQVYYDIPISDGGVTPTYIAYWQGVDLAVPGAGAAASFGVELHTIVSSGSGNTTTFRLYKINPLTGAVTVNVSLPFTGSDIANLYYRDGYYLSAQITNPNVGTARIVNWTEQGSSTNFTSRIVSNISAVIPPSYRASSPSLLYGTLGAYDPDYGITVIQSRFLFGNVYGYNLVAVDLNPNRTTTEQVIWNITSSPSEMSSAYRPTNAWARHGRYTAQMERGYWQSWDIQTGKVLWTANITDYPWGEFWMYDEAAYQDMLYGTGYTGVWAFNETNGNVVWQYVDPAIAFETPYNSNITQPDYSVQDIRVADGKIYVTNNEHTPSQPATRGWGMICLNATTGEFLWKINGANLVGGAASDGYLMSGSSYSGYLYSMGKGQSKITLTAPQTSVASGQSIVFSGTIMDLSSAQPNTPCVSDDSMATWMDYLHFQMPIDGYYHNITIKGVPISIDAVDPNGNFIHVADITSDSSGSFGYTWAVPSNSGSYQVMATFMGSDSYGSSFASSYVDVAQGGQVTPTPTTSGGAPVATTADLMTYMAIGVIIIVIAIAIVGALVLRRH